MSAKLNPRSQSSVSARWTPLQHCQTEAVSLTSEERIARGKAVHKAKASCFDRSTSALPLPISRPDTPMAHCGSRSFCTPRRSRRRRGSWDESATRLEAFTAKISPVSFHPLLYCFSPFLSLHLLSNV